MTTQELNEFLIREKETAEKALGCDMCKKYARCLYCYSRDEYRCAKAHNRLVSAIQRGRRRIPAYLLPEPPVETAPASFAPVKATEPPQVKPYAIAPEEKKEQTFAPKTEVSSRVRDDKDAGEEMIETIAHILSEFNMSSLSEDRARELQKISAMMDMDSSDPAEEPQKVIFRTQRIEGDVPLFKISRKKQQ